MKRIILLLTVVNLWPFGTLRAQLYAPNAEGVAMAHLHTIVRDVEATKKVWTAMGGQAIKIDETDVIKMPGFFIFLTQGSPTGGSYGSVLNHAGFFVPNVRESIAKWKAAGLNAEQYNDLDGYVYTPDDLKLEIKLDNNGRDKLRVLFCGPGGGEPPNKNAPLQMAHLHLWVVKSAMLELQAWYYYMLGATPGPPIGALRNPTNDGIPGLHLSISNSQDPNPPAVGLLHGAVPDAASLKRLVQGGLNLPSKGRTLDQIGFEVKNLEAFCKKLEAKGVKFDKPYSKSRHKSFASAELTDPWGISVELTEGLNRF